MDIHNPDSVSNRSCFVLALFGIAIAAAGWFWWQHMTRPEQKLGFTIESSGAPAQEIWTFGEEKVPALVLMFPAQQEVILKCTDELHVGDPLAAQKTGIYLLVKAPIDAIIRVPNNRTAYIYQEEPMRLLNPATRKVTILAPATRYLIVVGSPPSHDIDMPVPPLAEKQG